MPVFNPAYRPSNAARQKRNEEVFGIDVPLEAETPADVEREAAHARLGHAQYPCRFAANPMDDLSRTPDRHGVGARLVQGHDAAAFHGRGRVAMRIEAPLQPMRGRSKRGLDIALFHHELTDQVRAELCRARSRLRARAPVPDRPRQVRLQVQPARVGCIFRSVPALGQDDGNRFADMANLVVGEERLLRIVKSVLHRACPLLRQRQLRVRHGRQLTQEFGATEHMHDPRSRGSLCQVDRAYASMGDLTAHEHRVQQCGSTRSATN